jgi:hypothetical protein
MAAATTKFFRGEATRRRIVEQSAAVFHQSAGVAVPIAVGEHLAGYLQSLMAGNR